MPTYSYACTECGDRFDAVQAFTDDALTTCTKCSGKLRKLFSSVGVVFKGSGFYRTDSREASKSTAAAASSNGSAKSEGPKSDGGKSESSKSDGSKSDSSKSSTGSSEKSSTSSSEKKSSSSSTPSPAASK